MMAATPAPSNFLGELDDAERRGLGPAFDGHLAALGVDADGDAAGKEAAGLPHQLGIAHGDGSEDDARQALLQPGLDLRQRADAAAELHGVLRGLQDGFDRRAVAAFAGEGAVEVDHMQPGKALALEGPRLRGRVGVVDGRLRHVAELQAHALAVLEVDGGKQDHVRRLRR